jgi:hypothetical protein
MVFVVGGKLFKPVTDKLIFHTKTSHLIRWIYVSQVSESSFSFWSLRRMWAATR